MNNYVVDNIMCPECIGLMYLDSDPEMMKCELCGRMMSVDEVKGIEENPGEVEE
jgi:hypothetical protein